VGKFLKVMVLVGDPGIQQRVETGFQPLIDLAKALAYPLAFLAMAIGICLIIIDQRQKGWQTIKTAIVGYILMQWLPALMRIIRDVGDAMAR